MSNVIRPPQFDRPKVPQPHPRLRKGTINFRQRRWDSMMAKRLDGRTCAQVRDDSERARRALQETGRPDARDADMLPVYIQNTGRGAFAVYHALYQLGIKLEFCGTRQAIVMSVVDDRRPVA